MRRIHLRWYAAYCRVRSAIASIASASRAALPTSWRPDDLPSRRGERSGERRSRLLCDAGVEHRARARVDAAGELLARDVEADDERRMPRLRRPEPVVSVAQRRAGLGELERADDPCGGRSGARPRRRPGRARRARRAPPRRRGGRRRGSQCSRAPGCGCRRNVELGQRSAEVEARCRRRRPASGRRPSTLVDRRVGQPGVLGDRGLVVERPRSPTRCAGASAWLVRIGRPR